MRHLYRHNSFHVAVALLTGFLAGCGGGDDEASEATTAAAPTAAPTPAAQTATTAPASPTPEVDPDRKETKWIGKIPYDVFYDQPLTVAADTTVVGGTQPVNLAGTPAATPEMAPAGNTNSQPAASGGSSSSSTGSVDWAKIMPMPVLIEELKSIRTRLTANLQTVATYNREAQAIALDGAMVASMGAIITKHPEADSWKDRGKFIRDLGYEIYSNAGESGRTAYKATEEPFLQMQTALDGGTVDGLESEDEVPFGDVVYVGEMMQRIEFTFNNLKSNINTEARMKEDPAAVERELRVLAALGSMMGTESYDNSDAKQYQDYIATFVNGAMKGVESVKAEDYEGFRNGLNEIQTTCAECHQQYRGSESAF